MYVVFGGYYTKLTFFRLMHLMVIYYDNVNKKSNPEVPNRAILKAVPIPQKLPPVP